MVRYITAFAHIILTDDKDTSSYNRTL